MLLTRLPLITAIMLCALISGAIYWQASPYVENYLKQESPYTIAISVHNQTSTTLKKQDNNQKRYNISSFKLFGDAQSSPVKKAPIETEILPETTLKLTLTGVLAGTNNLQASALIEGPDRKTRSYRVDEEVPGGAILKHVYPDRVVLHRSGRLENLIFEEKRSIGIETQVNDTNEDEPVAALPRPSHSAKPNIDSFNKQQTQQIKDRLSRLRSRLQSNGP